MTSSLAPALGWAVTLMAFIAGCGPANPLGRKALSGTATLDGKPLERGAIEFHPLKEGGVQSGALISGEARADGFGE